MPRVEVLGRARVWEPETVATVAVLSKEAESDFCVSGGSELV